MSNTNQVQELSILIKTCRLVGHSKHLIRDLVRRAIRNNMEPAPQSLRTAHYMLTKDARLELKTAGESIAAALRDDDLNDLCRALNDLPDWAKGPALSKLQDCRGHCLAGDAFICPNCGEAEVLHESVSSDFIGEAFCGSCASDEWVYSDVMGDYIWASQASRYYDTARKFRAGDYDYVSPDSSACHDLYEYDGDYFSHEAYYELGFDNDDEYDDEDGEEYRSSRSGGPIGTYHSSKHKVGHIPSSWDKHTPRVLVGIELEVEVDTDASRQDMATEVLKVLNQSNPRYCACEADGSLDHGFEIVTGYGSLDMHREVLAEAFSTDKFDGVLTSHDTETCGLHITLDKANMTPFHAAKLIAFVHSPDNKALIQCVARRYGKTDSGRTDYAKFDYGKGKGVKAGKRALDNAKMYQREYGRSKEHANRTALQGMNQDRYEAVNFQNENLIEFRMFRGSLNYTTILACMEMSYAMWHFSAKAGMAELTDEAFCKFLIQPAQRAQTKILREYLQTNGHPAMLAVEPVKAEKAPAVEPVVEPVKAEEVFAQPSVEPVSSSNVGLDELSAIIARVNGPQFRAQPQA